jgi:CBS domain containing-hemolysin-like protein
MMLLLIYLLIALTVSFLCSIMEAVLLSTPMSYLKVKETNGSSAAGKMISLKSNIDKPLSAILSLNTVAHTVGAAGVGAQAVKIFGEAYFGLVSAILTILILVLTEIIPKTIGARFWRKLTFISAYLISISIIIVYPLVLLSSLLTGLFSESKHEKTVSREEISALANIGAEEGIFGESENRIIQNLIKLKSIRVHDVMTPRVVSATADENMSVREFLLNRRYLRFSRIPVYSGDKENITGYVFRQTAFSIPSAKNRKIKLKDIKRDIVVVNEAKPLFHLWELLLEKKEQIAVVFDEYGGMEGIVTLEDVIETLLGFEIIDENDAITDMQHYARERWKMRQTKYAILESIDKNKKVKLKKKN